MAETSIAVNLLNPGEVFACLGFLEAADVLLGDAEGGFDWSDETRVRFLLRALGDENPFAFVLRVLAAVDVCRLGPLGYTNPPSKKKEKDPTAGGNAEETEASADLSLSESFPDREGDRMALPIRLESPEFPPIDLGHWADGSSRNRFKLYAGNRSAHGIACDMLRGKRKKPKKDQSVGDLETHGIESLWGRRRNDLIPNPFEVLTSMAGSFNFDPRGAWTALDAGYSPNTQNHGIAASPVVEFLAAWGLEHARPDEYETRQVRYGAWRGPVPPFLARAALAGASIGVPIRTFRFALDLSGKNKVVTFAQEETNA